MARAYGKARSRRRNRLHNLPSLQAALEQRHQLAPGASLISPDGYWVGRHFLRVRRAEAAESAERRIVALERQIAQLESRVAQGATVVAQTESNLSLFVEQYKVGRRSLLELVSQYDSFARLERDQVALQYEIALLEIEIARDRGLLVDGARM